MKMETRGEIMGNYKIVFVDIDDTLNPSNQEVSEYTKEVMSKLKEKGIKVVLTELQYSYILLITSLGMFLEKISFLS